MAGTLRSRLARARELARGASPAAAQAASDDSLGTEHAERAKSEGQPRPDTVLAGWSPVAPYVLYRTRVIPNPLPPRLDLRPYLGGRFLRGTERAEPGKGTLAGWPASGAELQSLPVERLLFFDLETTGLSGGTGTVAFLAALGRALGRALPSGDGGGFEIRQYLLTDYPGEADFLASILNEIGPRDVLASYNGRSFDEPLLRTRCVMNRMRWPVLPHADFLFASRRLWKSRFPDCSLGTLERELLGRRRTLDVPSPEIPEIWFKFVREGFHPEMDAVTEHNAEDVGSLIAIASECLCVHSDPRAARGCDLAALGSLWLALDEAVGVATLERAYAEGREKAGWILLKHYRRRGILAEYERILKTLPPSLDTWVERAKHAEHRALDADAALRAAREAQSFAAGEKDRRELGRRIERLERRLATQSGAGRQDLPR